MLEPTPDNFIEWLSQQAEDRVFKQCDMGLCPLAHYLGESKGFRRPEVEANYWQSVGARFERHPLPDWARSYVAAFDAGGEKDSWWQSRDYALEAARVVKALHTPKPGGA